MRRVLRSSVVGGTRVLFVAFFFLAGCDCGAIHRLPSREEAGPVDAGRDAGDAAPTPDAGPDAAPDAAPDAGDAGPVADEFVLASVLYGDEDDGFDLDRHVTLDSDDPIGCGHADGRDGVDNQLGPVMTEVDTLLDVDSEGLLAAAIDGGILLMLFRLVGADDRVDDADVHVHVFNGVDENGIALADPTDNLSGDARFYIAPESVVGGDETDPIIDFGGALDAEVFTGGPVDFFVSLPLGPDTFVPVTLHDAELRFHLYARRFLDGTVGGAVPARDIVSAVRDIPEYADQAGFIEIALYANADLDLVPEGPTGVVCIEDRDCERGQTCVDLVCEEPPAHCDALSGAVRVTGVSAQILGVWPGK